MKPRISLFVAFAILLAAATASGAPAALYRIELRDGTRVLAQDRPYHRGSVVLFHLYPRGVLTSLPEEEVVGVTTSAVEVTQKVLRPGDVIVLGPTGAGAALEPPAAVVVAPMMSGRVYDPRNPAYGYSPPRANLNQPGATSLTLPVVPGDVGRAVSAEPPNLEPPVGPNGFPAAPGTAAPIIGSDGRPILAPVGAPGSTPPAIGPNGTPVLAPSGAPGSTPPPVGPNGYPAPRGPGG